MKTVSVELTYDEITQLLGVLSAEMIVNGDYDTILHNTMRMIDLNEAREKCQ